MHAFRRLIDPTKQKDAITIRPQRAGDLGWVLQRHAVIYKVEFGYSNLFEAYVCEGLANFVTNYNPKTDGLWIGEAASRRTGSVAVQHVSNPPHWAQLRWFLVEKHARREGLGSRLLTTAIAFCKKARYEGVFLWTVNDLIAARNIYQKFGFTLVREKQSCPWALWAREERWELRF
jgi:GNAT superfamily N-acetyltransferase